MQMMINFLCDMVVLRKTLSLRLSPSQTSNTRREKFETAHKPSSGFVKRSYAVLVTTT